MKLFAPVETGQRSRSGELTGIQGIEVRVATAYADAGNQQALAIDREVQDRRGEGVILYYLARIAQEREDFESAEALHRQSLQIARDIGSDVDIAPSLVALGQLLIEQRDARHEGCQLEVFPDPQLIRREGFVENPDHHWPSLSEIQARSPDTSSAVDSTSSPLTPKLLG